MTPDAAGPAVVVLGQLNGLGIVRSLGGAGVGSLVVDRTRVAPAMWSRHAKPVLAEAVEGDKLVTALLALRARLDTSPVLFNTHELAVATISAKRHRLAGPFRFRLTEHGMLMRLQDKGAFQELAARLGLPVPGGLLLRRRADLRELGRLRCPLVLKPANKDHVHTALSPGVIVCDRLDFAIAKAGRLLDAGVELIAQDWIDGRGDEIYFCLFYSDGNGRVPAMFTGRKLASSPPAQTTAYCTAAPEAAPELERITRSFIEQVGYAGIGGLEFKWDRSTRRFLIVEPTVGRSDLQLEIATLYGVNIPLIAFRHELGERCVAPSPARRPIVWRASALERLKGARPSLPPGAAIHDGYWRNDDPVPALTRYGWGVFASLLHRWRRARPASSPAPAPVFNLRGLS